MAGFAYIFLLGARCEYVSAELAFLQSGLVCQVWLTKFGLDWVQVDEFWVQDMFGVGLITLELELVWESLNMIRHCHSAWCCFCGKLLRGRQGGLSLPPALPSPGFLNLSATIHVIALDLAAKQIHVFVGNA